MTGLGNDLIDLKTTDAARTQSTRFYTKILADTEQQLYQNQFAAFPFEQFVWLLWSIKESAYKALQRHQPELVFTPVKMVITSLIAPQAPHPLLSHKKTTTTGFDITHAFKSFILFQNQTLYARSVIYGDELIHTVATTQDWFDHIHWGIRRVTETSHAGQSAAVRAFLLERLTSLYPAVKLAVEKSDFGYPFIVADGVAVDWPVSLSHHGEFVGYGVMV